YGCARACSAPPKASTRRSCSAANRTGRGRTVRAKTSARQHVGHPLEGARLDVAQEPPERVGLLDGEVRPPAAVGRGLRRGLGGTGFRPRFAAPLLALAALLADVALVVGDVVQRHLDAELLFDEALDLCRLGVRP